MEKLFTYFSSWFKLRRAVAWILRLKKCLLRKITNKRVTTQTALQSWAGIGPILQFYWPIIRYNIVPRLFGHGPLIGPILAIFKLANIGPLLAQYQDQYWANVEPILFSVGNSLASNIVPRLFGHGPWLGPILACPW